MMKDKSTTKKSSKLKELFSWRDSLQGKNETLTSENNDSLLNYYSSLANNHPDIVIVFSRECEIVTIDIEKLQVLLGQSIQTIDQLKSMLSPNSYIQLKSAFHNTLKGNTEKHEIEIKTNSNEALTFILTFIPIKNRGEIEGAYLIVTNITEKALLKQKLISSEKHLNSAQQIAEIGSWEYLIEEDQLYCSDNFYYIFG